MPKSGIPYTLTDVSVTGTDKIVIKGAGATEELADKTISYEITEPATDAPVTVEDGTDANTFNVTLEKVTEPTTVKILFTIKDPTDPNKILAKREVSFKVLPEPVVTGLTGLPERLDVALGYEGKLEPKIVCNPNKFGEFNASDFIKPENKQITYESGDDDVVTVDQDGNVKTPSSLTGGKNSADITVKLSNTEGVIKTVTIPVNVENTVSPTALNASKTAINLQKDNTMRITIKPEPANGSVKISQWTNSNASVGSIEETGNAGEYKITALKNGKTTFTAVSKYNPSIIVKIDLTVSSELLQSIKVTPGTITLEKGEKHQLNVTVTPAFAPSEVVWSSSKPETVSVDKNGLITALDNGKAVITATSTADNTKLGRCIVTVAAKAGAVKITPESPVELAYTDELQLSASIEPAGAPQAVNWSVDDSTLLSISSTGKITAKSKKGIATVTATAKSDSSKKAEITVYIAPSKVDSVTALPSVIFMDTNGEESFQITVAPSNATQLIDWEVEGDNLTVEKQGSSMTFNVKSGNLAETKNITVWSKANPEKKVTIPVTTSVPEVTSITLEDKTITTEQISGQKMIARVEPANAVQTVTWSSDNDTVVMIDENTGDLIPLAKGTAAITATSTANPLITATATVTVVQPITAITKLTASSDSVYFGSDITVTAELNPTDGWGDLKWSCNNDDLILTKDPSDEKICKISAKKTAKKGTATITVTSGYNSEITKSIDVTVKTIVPKSISILPYGSELKMYKNEELQLSIKAEKVDYTQPTANTEVEWTFESPWYSSYLTITDDGKLKCKSNVYTRTYTIKATSKLDPSITATKKVEVVQNKAVINSVGVDIDEYTLGSYNSPEVTVGYNYDDEPLNKFLVCDEWGYPATNYFVETEVSIGTWNLLELKPKKHTSGKPKTFCICPIDPKTGKADTTDKTKTFELTIWEIATGIKIIKGNGLECTIDDDGNYVLRINKSDKSENLKVEILPKYAKPRKFSFKIEGDTNIDSNYYAYITDWTSTSESTTFTIRTRDIGFAYGSKHNIITFKSEKFTEHYEPELSRRLYVTIVK